MKGPVARLLSGLASAALVSALACGAPPIERPSVPVASASGPVAVASSAPTAPVEKVPRPNDRFAVATENETALQVASLVLDRGGNAVDAAVAGVLAAGVAQPSSTGLGGDGFAVVWDAGKKAAFVVDFRARAPKGLKRKDHLSRTPPKKKRGAMVGVPGLVAGLFAMHQRGGKLPWADVVKPAAEVAEQGFEVSPYLAEALSWLSHEKDVDPDFSVGAPVGGSSSPIVEGARLANPALADTLRAIASGGKKAFYTGDIARDVVDAARASGSAITQADLSQYEPTVRDPLRAEWEGFQILAAPPPSGGGVAVAELCGLFPKSDLAALGLDSSLYVHFLAEGLRTTLADRQVLVGDPDFTKMDVPSVLDRERLVGKRASFRRDTTTMPKIRSIAEGGTHHLAVIDEAGSAVSITTTLTDLFGAKIATHGGFPLNDALTDFTMDDYGQRPTNRGPNFPRGGARPASSLAPTLIMKDGAVVLALGASGGLRAPASVSQVLFTRLVFDKTLSDSIAHPRFYVPSSGALFLDKGLANLEDDLKTRGEVVDAKRPDFSAVSAVEQRLIDGHRVLTAAGDPRKHGVSLVRAGKSTPAPAE